MPDVDPLSQAITMAEDLRTSATDTIDSVLSQGVEQVKRMSPGAPPLPGIGGSTPGSSNPASKMELPGKFPVLPELAELPELPEFPEAPKARESPSKTPEETPEETPSKTPSKKTTTGTTGQVQGF